MKIELKNFKSSELASEETTFFVADVFIDGKKCAFSKNDGRGGCTYYSPYPKMNDLVIQAELYCKGLPKIQYTFGEEVHDFEQSLESVIDDLVVQKLLDKEMKKIHKLCETKIVYGKSNTSTYRYIGFKNKHRIEDVKKHPNGRAALDNLIAKIKKEMGPDEVIFNTNIYD
jgi:hypothetical protein